MSAAAQAQGERPPRKNLSLLKASADLRTESRLWFDRLRREVFEQGKPYVIASPNTANEVFEALDLPFMTDVWYSALVAARRQSKYYSDYLAGLGFHDGLSRYGSLATAVLFDESNPDKPWGGLSQPAMVVGTGGRAGAILAERYQIPFINVESPAQKRLNANWWEMSRWQWEDFEGSDRIDMMVAQMKELVTAAEQVAGKKMDYDRLQQVLDKVNEQEEYLDKVRDLVCAAPKMPLRMTETMNQTVGINWHRGTDWAVGRAKAFYEEVKQRVENHQWVVPGEKYRMGYSGTFPSQALEFFSKFEESHGAVWVRSNYLGFVADIYPRYGGRDPLRALAARVATHSAHMHQPPAGAAWQLWDYQRHRVVAGLQLTTWPGGKYHKNVLEANGIPMQWFGGDPVDANKWDEDRLTREVAQFLETRVEQAYRERRAQYA